MTVNNLPLLYTQPEPLNPQAHGKLAIHADAGFRFAAKTNSVPLLVEEFGAACRDYPILFTGGDNVVPLVVLGIQPDHNAFVDANGQWAPNTYIPAYIRRYPFVLSETPGSDEWVLCIDRNEEWVSESGQQALFNDEQKPAELIQQALDFCGRFQQQMQVTREFCSALQEADLLVEQEAQVTLANGENAKLSGFRIIDEQKVRALSDAQLRQFHDRGWLGVIFAHLIATGSWNRAITQIAANPPAAS